MVSLLAPVMFPRVMSQKEPEIGQQLKGRFFTAFGVLLLRGCLLLLGGGGKLGLPIRNPKVVPLHQKAQFYRGGVFCFFGGSLKSLHQTFEGSLQTARGKPFLLMTSILSRPIFIFLCGGRGFCLSRGDGKKKNDEAPS